MTDKQSNQQPDPQSYPPYYEDEINLIDYLRVIWKWKWLVVAGTLICAVVAAVISLQMPRIYEVSMMIEPGIAGIKNGGFIYIDSAENISGKIGEGIYNRRIEEALSLGPLKARVKFKSVVVKKANIIKVTSQWQEGNTDLGVKGTRQIIRFLSDDYAKIIEQRKGDYDNQIFMKQSEINEIGTKRKDIDKQILMKQNEISKVETQGKDIDKQIKLELSEIEKIRNEIKMKQATLGNIEQRKGELQEEIKGVKDNTEKIVQQQGALLKDERPGKDLSLLLYSTTIQQNVSYFNQLTNQLYDLGTREKTIETEVDRLSKRIDDIKTGIERLNLSKMEGLQAKIYDIKTEIEKIKLHKTEGLQTKIDDIKAQINTLNLEKELISNIKIIQEPEVSLHPVKPKKKQIVLLAGFASLFMFVFLAFFIEYIRNASKED
ncbi:MAG: Wzz/FepE/Etk N-terminal domain-containing protein [Syntrophales bacterium]|nr:Wzz/FepE/Etk N-terminal domain-containing protein [Syntrophales bacterium]